MLTIDEYAAAIGKSTRTVRRMLDRNEIDGAVKMGNQWHLPDPRMEPLDTTPQPVAQTQAQQVATRTAQTMQQANVGQQSSSPMAMLSVDEVATLLGITPHGVRTLIKSGVLAGHDVGTKGRTMLFRGHVLGVAMGDSK